MATYQATVQVQEVPRLRCRICDRLWEESDLQDGGCPECGHDHALFFVDALVCPFGCQGDEFFATIDYLFAHIARDHVSDLIAALVEAAPDASPDAA